MSTFDRMLREGDGRRPSSAPSAWRRWIAEGAQRRAARRRGRRVRRAAARFLADGPTGDIDEVWGDFHASAPSTSVDRWAGHAAVGPVDLRTAAGGGLAVAAVGVMALVVLPMLLSAWAQGLLQLTQVGQ